jgi:hypothetical protein
MTSAHVYIILVIRAGLFVVFYFCAVAGYTQQYEVFRLGLSIGNAKPNLYAFEASIGHRLAFGIRVDTYFQNAPEKSFSTTAFGNYYLNTHVKHLRPYVSIGGGSYHISPEASRAAITNGSGIIMYEYTRANMDTKGLFTRLGLDYRHISMVAEYNFIYRREATATYADANFYPLPDLTKQIYLSDNYFTIRIGLYIGNGLKK